jgi:hypothetical protein
MSSIRRASAATAHFVLDLLAIDTPEVIVTTCTVLVLALLLHRETALAVVVLPVVALVGLSVGIWRERGNQPGA